MPRDFKVYLDAILQAISKVREYSAGYSSVELAGDTKTFDAVIRNLEVIGEAVKGVPEPIRLQHPEVDWKKFAGLRDILIHQYFGVNDQIIWDIIQNKLPTLEEQVRTILKT